jgi:hypothetical protein
VKASISSKMYDKEEYSQPFYKIFIIIPFLKNNCYWALHNESIERCKHHMQEKLVYGWTYLENL